MVFKHPKNIRCTNIITGGSFYLISIAAIIRLYVYFLGLPGSDGGIGGV